MRKRSDWFLLLTGFLTGFLLLSSVASARDAISWQPTLESAKRAAAQTNRLVLIHFWADWCKPCKKMEREVLSQPAVATVVNSHFSPVKINRDHFPAMCRRYGVTALPSDIIITPQGELVGRFKGMVGARDYVARLNHISASRQRPLAVPRPHLPVAHTQPIPRHPNQPPAAIDHRTPTGPGYPPSRPPGTVQAYPTTVPPILPPTIPRHQVAAAQPYPPVGGSARAPVQSPPSQAAAQPASDNPPLGLEGYCSVQLNDDLQRKKLRWTRGDPRWGVIHRGRTYLFSGSEQQRRFLADPDRFAPVLSGNDVVIAIDQRQMVPGRREHGVLFDDRIYLFATESTLNTFAANRKHYASLAMQAMLADTARQRGAASQCITPRQTLFR